MTVPSGRYFTGWSKTKEQQSLTTYSSVHMAVKNPVIAHRHRAWLGAGTVRVLAITLPFKISFYTFHALSYTIDVYRGTAAPVRSFIDFACYIALFRQLVAGPIIRYSTVADQLVSRSHTLEKFSSGVTLFILGFAKKI
jgi:alginate O-acetyltransferase complex protein AlgI